MRVTKIDEGCLNKKVTLRKVYKAREFKYLEYGKEYIIGAVEISDEFIMLLYDENHHAISVKMRGDVFKYVKDKSSIQRPALEERKVGKVKMQLFDEGFPNAILEIAKVMGWAEENKGYKPNDFKNLPNAETEFSAAASRHRVKGFIQKAQSVPAIERTDEESNIVHLAHTAFNVLAELELVLTGKIK